LPDTLAQAERGAAALETMAAQMADQSEATEKETKNARRVTKIVSWSALALAAAAAALNFL
jgi:hypothetical protein